MGERKSLAKLKKMARDDLELQLDNLSEVQKQDLINDLIKARAAKRTNACGSNRVASRDVHATIEKVTCEVSIHTFVRSTTRLNNGYSLTPFSCALDFVHGC